MWAKTISCIYFDYRSKYTTDIEVSPRTYGQACPVAHALDMIGERWAMLVVRELRLGPRRYLDLQASLPGIGPSVLAQRLRDLEGAGVIERQALPAPAKAHVYALTEHGAELEPVFAALARWGLRSPVPLAGELTDDSVMLGFPTFFHRSDAPPWTATYAVRLTDERYVLRVRRGRLTELTRSEPAGPPDAIIETTRETMAALMSGAQTVKAAAQAGTLTVTGDEAAVQRLIAATSLGSVPVSAATTG